MQCLMAYFLEFCQHIKRLAAKPPHLLLELLMLPVLQTGCMVRSTPLFSTVPACTARSQSSPISINGT